MVIVKWL